MSLNVTTKIFYNYDGQSPSVNDQGGVLVCTSAGTVVKKQR